jgi:hypothetical protein
MRLLIIFVATLIAAGFAGAAGAANDPWEEGALKNSGFMFSEYNGRGWYIISHSLKRDTYDVEDGGPYETDSKCQEVRSGPRYQNGEYFKYACRFLDWKAPY